MMRTASVPVVMMTLLITITADKLKNLCCQCAALAAFLVVILNVDE